MSDELSGLSAYGSVGSRTCYQLLFWTIYENLSPLPLQVRLSLSWTFFIIIFLKSVHEFFF